MKFLVNKSFGGFGLSSEFLKKYNIDEWRIERDDKKLIKAIEEYGIINAQDEYAKLEIIEIKEEITDYYIDDYDGFETIYYVVNGKIYTA